MSSEQVGVNFLASSYLGFGGEGSSGLPVDGQVEDLYQPGPPLIAGPISPLSSCRET